MVIETLLLRGGLALAGDGLARPLPSARVRARPLAPDRESPSVPQPAVAPDFHQALDVQVDFAAQVAFNLVFPLDDVAQARHLFVGQITDSRIRANLGLTAELLSQGRPNSVDVPQRNVDALVARDVDSGDSGHDCSPLALLLLVLWIRADDKDVAIAADDSTFLAAGFHRRSYLHRRSPASLLRRSRHKIP